MRPLVSIILPVYNVEHYIMRCLKSIVNQTYENLEIIIVNDGTTDKSMEVGKEFFNSDQRIKIIDQENMGLGEARNTGLRACNGDFIAFIDSDDWIETQMIELLVNSAVCNDSDISCCGYNSVTKDETYSTFIDLELNNQRDYFALCFNEVYRTRKRLITTVWAKLFKSSVLKRNFILFSLTTFEDTPFFIKAVYYSKKISFVSEPLYNYTYRENSLSNSPISERKLKCFYCADEIILSFLKEKDLYATYQEFFEAFHFLRIVYYGGCRQLYWNRKGPIDSHEYLIFIKYLRTKEKFFKTIKPDRLSMFERKVLAVLKAGLFLSKIDVRLPNTVFKLASWVLKQ